MLNTFWPIFPSIIRTYFDFRGYSQIPIHIRRYVHKGKKKCKLMKYKIKYNLKCKNTKSLKCSLRHLMHLYAQVWLACQANWRVDLLFRAWIKKHPGEGEWLLVQKCGSSVFSYTTSFVFMSSWWMQCNLTLILSKSSWKVGNCITIYLFLQPTTRQHDKSQGLSPMVSNIL